MDAKITLGVVQDVEKLTKNFFGRPPARTSEFFFAPGGLQERSGVDFYSVLGAPWGPGGAQGVPGGLRELICGHLGATLPPCWHLFGVMLGAVLAPVLGPFSYHFDSMVGSPGHHFQRSALIPSFSFRLRSSFFHEKSSCTLCSARRLLSASVPAPSARWPVLGRMPQ